MTTEVVGDLMVDEETGEIIGTIHDATRDAANPWLPTDEAGADWVLARMQELDAQTLAVQVQTKAIMDQMDARCRELQRRRDWLLLRFGSALEQIAKAGLKGKSRTLKLVHGSLSFRQTPGSIKVTDLDKALAWDEIWNEGHATKVTKSILVSTLKDLDPNVLPADAFEVAPPVDKFSVNTGIKL